MKMKSGLLAVSVLILISCGGGSSTPEPPPPPVVTPPSAATLIFPDNNAECNEGTIISDTQSSVLFQWNASQNTDTYELNYRNLDNNNTAKTNASTNQAQITLLRGTPYEWYVVSKANGTNTTATSAVWKFYNQGPGVENYAPFPADAVSPARGSSVSATGTISLIWAGSDVDNDLAEFDIYFGTDAAALTLLGTTSESTIDANIAASTVYYWRVISRDSQGNTSQSEIFEFRVE